MKEKDNESGSKVIEIKFYLDKRKKDYSSLSYESKSSENKIISFEEVVERSKKKK